MLIKDGEPNEVAGAVADMERDLAGSADLVAEFHWVAREYEEYPDSAEAQLVELDLQEMAIVRDLGRDGTAGQ